MTATNKKEEIKEEPKEVEPEVRLTSRLVGKVELKEGKAEPKDTITIPKDTFDRMVKDIDMLKETSDRRRMALYQHRHKGDQVPMVRLRELDGKVIMGWRMIKNDVHFDRTKKTWVEDQVVELLFEDGKSEKVVYGDYINNYRTIECDQIGTIEEGGQVALKLRRKDNGKEYTIGVAYVN